MKKILCLLVSVLLLTTCFCGCKDEKAKESQTDNAKVQEDTAQYTYTVNPLQGVSNCVYYGPNDKVPNSPNQEAARNKIHVWTVCPTCGGDGDAWDYTINVKDLDFSSGDTIQYSQSTSCFDCQWERNIPSFMWSISITRKKVVK